MTPTQLAAILGFAFVAVWIVLDFGDAVLCLVGALVFAIVAAIMRGELDVAEWQARLGSPRAGAARRPPL